MTRSTVKFLIADIHKKKDKGEIVKRIKTGWSADPRMSVLANN